MYDRDDITMRHASIDITGTLKNGLSVMEL